MKDALAFPEPPCKNVWSQLVCKLPVKEDMSEQQIPANRYDAYNVHSRQHNEDTPMQKVECCVYPYYFQYKRYAGGAYRAEQVLL